MFFRMVRVLNGFRIFQPLNGTKQGMRWFVYLAIPPCSALPYSFRSTGVERVIPILLLVNTLGVLLFNHNKSVFKGTGDTAGAKGIT